MHQLLTAVDQLNDEREQRESQVAPSQQLSKRIGIGLLKFVVQDVCTRCLFKQYTPYQPYVYGISNLSHLFPLPWCPLQVHVYFCSDIFLSIHSGIVKVVHSTKSYHLSLLVGLRLTAYKCGRTHLVLPMALISLNRNVYSRCCSVLHIHYVRICIFAGTPTTDPAGLCQQPKQL